MFFNKKDNDSKQRFGIRKLTVGACSVLLSTLILGVEMQEPTSKVQAATTDTSNNYSTTEPAKNSKNTYLTSSEVKETTTEKRQKDMPSRLNARRKMMKTLNKVKDVDLTSKLFNEIAPKYAGKNVGGYTRIIKAGPRRGDGAEVAILQLI